MAENENSENKRKFDQAAVVAQKSLEKIIENATPDQKKGIEMFRDWWKNCYMSAGHKRLGRVVVGTFRPGQ